MKPAVFLVILFLSLALVVATEALGYSAGWRDAPVLESPGAAGLPEGCTSVTDTDDFEAAVVEAHLVAFVLGNIASAGYEDLLVVPCTYEVAAKDRRVFEVTSYLVLFRLQ